MSACGCRPVIFGNPICKHCRQRHPSGWDCRLDSMISSEVTGALMRKLFKKKRRKDGGPNSATLTKIEWTRAKDRATRAWRKLTASERASA